MKGGAGRNEALRAGVDHGNKAVKSTWFVSRCNVQRGGHMEERLKCIVPARGRGDVR